VSLSVAHVPTGSASRYLQQLSKHWSHKMTVTFDAERSTIDFPQGARLEMLAGPDALECRLTVPDLTGPGGGDPARMRAVVEDHLNRFAFREAPLTFPWSDQADSSPR